MALYSACSILSLKLLRPPYVLAFASFDEGDYITSGVALENPARPRLPRREEYVPHFR
jgi:hypothetical protein